MLNLEKVVEELSGLSSFSDQNSSSEPTITQIEFVRTFSRLKSPQLPIKLEQHAKLVIQSKLELLLRLLTLPGPSNSPGPQTSSKLCSEEIKDKEAPPTSSAPTETRGLPKYTPSLAKKEQTPKEEFLKVVFCLESLKLNLEETPIQDPEYFLTVCVFLLEYFLDSENQCITAYLMETLKCFCTSQEAILCVLDEKLSKYITSATFSKTILAEIVKAFLYHRTAAEEQSIGEENSGKQGEILSGIPQINYKRVEKVINFYQQMFQVIQLLSGYLESKNTHFAARYKVFVYFLLSDQWVLEIGLTKAQLKLISNDIVPELDKLRRIALGLMIPSTLEEKALSRVQIDERTAEEIQKCFLKLLPGSNESEASQPEFLVCLLSEFYEYFPENSRDFYDHPYFWEFLEGQLLSPVSLQRKAASSLLHRVMVRSLPPESNVEQRKLAIQAWTSFFDILDVLDNYASNLFKTVWPTTCSLLAVIDQPRILYCFKILVSKANNHQNESIRKHSIKFMLNLFASPKYNPNKYSVPSSVLFNPILEKMLLENFLEALNHRVFFSDTNSQLDTDSKVFKRIQECYLAKIVSMEKEGQRNFVAKLIKNIIKKLDFHQTSVGFLSIFAHEDFPEISGAIDDEKTVVDIFYFVQRAFQLLTFRKRAQVIYFMVHLLRKCASKEFMGNNAFVFLKCFYGTMTQKHVKRSYALFLKETPGINDYRNRAFVLSQILDDIGMENSIGVCLENFDSSKKEDYEPLMVLAWWIEKTKGNSLIEEDVKSLLSEENNFRIHALLADALEEIKGAEMASYRDEAKHLSNLVSAVCLWRITRAIKYLEDFGYIYKSLLNQNSQVQEEESKVSSAKINQDYNAKIMETAVQLIEKELSKTAKGQLVLVETLILSYKKSSPMHLKRLVQVLPKISDETFTLKLEDCIEVLTAIDTEIHSKPASGSSPVYPQSLKLKVECILLSTLWRISTLKDMYSLPTNLKDQLLAASKKVSQRFDLEELQDEIEFYRSDDIKFFLEKIRIFLLCVEWRGALDDLDKGGILWKIYQRVGVLVTPKVQVDPENIEKYAHVFVRTLLLVSPPQGGLGSRLLCQVLEDFTKKPSLPYYTRIGTFEICSWLLKNPGRLSEFLAPIYRLGTTHEYRPFDSSIAYRPDLLMPLIVKTKRSIVFNQEEEVLNAYCSFPRFVVMETLVQLAEDPRCNTQDLLLLTLQLVKKSNGKKLRRKSMPNDQFHRKKAYLWQLLIMVSRIFDHPERVSQIQESIELVKQIQKELEDTLSHQNHSDVKNYTEIFQMRLGICCPTIVLPWLIEKIRMEEVKNNYLISLVFILGHCSMSHQVSIDKNLRLEAATLISYHTTSNAAYLRGIALHYVKKFIDCFAKDYTDGSAKGICEFSNHFNTEKENSHIVTKIESIMESYKELLAKPSPLGILESRIEGSIFLKNQYFLDEIKEHITEYLGQFKKDSGRPVPVDILWKE